MSAAERVLTDPIFVLKILKTLSSMKYKVKRQFAPETPVEWLEFRPTLVPSILVSRLWASEGTSVLWENYPHLLAMADMPLKRKQYYANKIRKVFIMSPLPGSPISLEHLRDLQWPLLESLEMDINFAWHGDQIRSMMGPNLKHLELSGYQSEGAEYFGHFVLPTIFGLCTSLESIRFGPAPIGPEDRLPSSWLEENMYSVPSITSIALRTTRFTYTTPLFMHLSAYPNLASLEVEIEPGTALLPFLSEPPEPIFTTLTSLNTMIYPEVALALLPHLHALENLQLDICRVPDHPAVASDIGILNDLLNTLPNMPHLKTLKIGIGALSEGLPSLIHPLKLSGTALRSLPTNCPDLTDITIFAAEPGTIDGSSISPSDFSTFCAGLNLRNLSLKLHPSTTNHLSATLLSSLGHCPLLTTLKVGVVLDFTQLSLETPTFPNLLELSFTPPEFLVQDEPTEDEEAYIRTFAAGLETYFPELEILEAWGGEEEDLAYVEPFENTLASVWEFLTGQPQDLWDEDDLEEGEDGYEEAFGEALPMRVGHGGTSEGLLLEV
ncbi:uncharacterized protein BDZ99DRAFT_452187 [Mytilinidion resinicola]|uniref:RNI-like protein n=1 Tax=Mytilinidion resinicola TaxID=574789 RepID=A0A6A6Y6Z2_9PEZI|nr:uncharacterized protein BDZ99DRAFT_452187 [Mytilinidion resinicola]KAF2804293.1 hypothetical protein BDZ99DRAFT_452187 [Mytilinidion resinicola]